jgi:hypothetical protein
MLKIDTHNGTEATAFTLAGKLAGPWVRVLEECWRTAASQRPGGAITVNLTDVSFVNAEGRDLLTRMRQQGVTIVATGLVMKAVIEEIEAGAGRA